MALSYSSPGESLSNLQAAYLDRLGEANELFALGRYGSAIALGLYALEIYLKVRICLRLDLPALPKPFQVHELDSLLVLSGLQARMDRLGNHPTKIHWGELSTSSMKAIHSNELRYQPNANWSRSEAATVLHRIQDPTEGVLTWLLAQT